VVLIWYNFLDQFVSFDGPVLREVKGRIGIDDPLFKIAALLDWALGRSGLNISGNEPLILFPRLLGPVAWLFRSQARARFEGSIGFHAVLWP
jgi:hypothetical protein